MARSIEESNAWAREQNRAPGRHANYYLTEARPGGGTRSVEDPYYSSSEWINNPNSGFGKPTEAGSLMLDSRRPNSAFYSPTGSDWQTLTEGMLSDPAIAQKVMQNKQFGALASKIPGDVRQGIEGSKHSLDPSILSKMWR